MQPPREGHGETAASEARDRRVLLLGGSVRTAAESASRGGFTVVAADRFGDTDTLAATARHLPFGTPDDLVAALDRLPSMPTVIVGGLEGAAEMVERLSQRHPVLGPSWETHLGLRDPDRLHELVAGCGLSVPEFCRPDGTADVPPSGPDWLWKRLDSSGGLGVTWAGRDVDPVGPATNRAAGYFQRWVPGRPLGLTYLGDGGTARLLGVFRLSFVRRGGGRLPFVYAGAFGPVAVSPKTEERMRGLGPVIARAFGLRGLFNIDVIAGRSGELCLLEVNPRWSGTSDLVESSLRQHEVRTVGAERSPFSLFRTHWEFLRGRRLGGEDSAFQDAWPLGGDRPTRPGDREHSTTDRWWKRVAFSDREGRFSRQRLDAVSAACPLDIRIGDLPADGHPVAPGEPIVSVTCKLAGVGRSPAAFPVTTLRRLMAAVRDTILPASSPRMPASSPRVPEASPACPNHPPG